LSDTLNVVDVSVPTLPTTTLLDPLVPLSETVVDFEPYATVQDDTEFVPAVVHTDQLNDTLAYSPEVLTLPLESVLVTVRLDIRGDQYASFHTAYSASAALPVYVSPAL
jgi:hypothetical protein